MREEIVAKNFMFKKFATNEISVDKGKDTFALYIMKSIVEENLGGL